MLVNRSLNESKIDSFNRSESLKNTSVILYLFWFTIVIYLDPGGYMTFYLPPLFKTALNFVFLGWAFLLYFYFQRFVKAPPLFYSLVKRYLFIITVWNLYFFLVHNGFNRNGENVGFIVVLIRNSPAIYQSLIPIPIAFFMMFSSEIFLKVLVWTSIIVGSIFIGTVFLGLGIMPYWTAPRGIGGLNRTFMYGNGIISFIVPVAIALRFFRYRISFPILIATIVAIVIIFMSIWRRDIIGIMEFVVIVAALTALIEGKKIFASIRKYFNLRSLIWVFSGFLVIQLLFPQFIENSIDLTVETLERINLIESSRHTENDARMSLAGKKSIIKAFEQNPWIGTGYHDAWMTGDGGRNEWEGADYVFLACLAMYGLIGLLLFLPFYVFVFGRIATFIKISMNNYSMVKNRQDLVLPLVFGVASSSEFIKNLIEYPNWFYPIGAVPTHEKYFIYFGVLLGSIVCLSKNLKKKDHVRTY